MLLFFPALVLHVFCLIIPRYLFLCYCTWYIFFHFLLEWLVSWRPNYFQWVYLIISWWAGFIFFWILWFFFIDVFVCLFIYVLFCLFGAAPTAYEGSRARGRIGAVAPACTTATATWDPSRVCDLQPSSRQRQILNPLSKARDRTYILTDTSRAC